MFYFAEIFLMNMIQLITDTITFAKLIIVQFTYQEQLSKLELNYCISVF
jgi:hypothetical protein